MSGRREKLSRFFTMLRAPHSAMSPRFYFSTGSGIKSERLCTHSDYSDPTADLSTRKYSTSDIRESVSNFVEIHPHNAHCHTTNHFLPPACEDENGQTRPSGDFWSSADGCTNHACVDGVVFSVREPCPPPPQDPSCVELPGTCCPRYQCDGDAPQPDPGEGLTWTSN